jgi:plastocyanin
VVVASIAVGFLFYGNLIPTTSSEVVVIIPKGASMNASLGFEPSNITVVIGVNNTVVWKNEDSDWHTATSDIPEFDSGMIPPGGSFTHTFLRAGTYAYHCDPHPWMTGVDFVKAATSTGIITFWPYGQGQQPIVPITWRTMCVEE